MMCSWGPVEPDVTVLDANDAVGEGLEPVIVSHDHDGAAQASGELGWEVDARALLEAYPAPAPAPVTRGSGR
jgi:hypothetical protein